MQTNICILRAPAAWTILAGNSKPGRVQYGLVKTYDLVKGRVKASKPVQDTARARRLQNDAQRTMSTNLSEGIALSRTLARFVGVARRK